MNWDYGGHIIEFPIKENEIWGEDRFGSRVMVADISDGVPRIFDGVHINLLYVDPPWNKGNVNSFITKLSGGKQHISDFFDDFVKPYFQVVKGINPDIFYTEIGKQNVQLFEKMMHSLFEHVQVWKVTYYKKHESFVIRGSNYGEIGFDFTGLDDGRIPGIAIDQEEQNGSRIETVGDVCMGKGLTLLYANANGKRFIGSELNPKRIALGFYRAKLMGFNYHRLEPIK